MLFSSLRSAAIVFAPHFFAEMKDLFSFSSRFLCLRLLLFASSFRSSFSFDTLLWLCNYLTKLTWKRDEKRTRKKKKQQRKENTHERNKKFGWNHSKNKLCCSPCGSIPIGYSISSDVIHLCVQEELLFINLDWMYRFTFGCAIVNHFVAGRFLSVFFLTFRLAEAVFPWLKSIVTLRHAGVANRTNFLSKMANA